VDDSSRGEESLYGLPLDSFTRERDRRVKQLRSEGKRDAADALASLRKPTAAAWAINQLARKHARLVDLLLDASHRLVDAQRTGKTGDELSRVNRRQREAIDKLVHAARELLADRASEQTIRHVTETLRAASLTEEGRELLARGEVTQPISTTGWDIFAATASAPTAPTRKKTTGRKPANDRSAKIAASREQLHQARAAHAQAVTNARTAENARQHAQEALADADRRHREAQAKLRIASTQLAQANNKLDRLTRNEPI
jgi:hypothetical protein